MTIANALTIAGSDSGGGAGIQADLKSFSANGVYGLSVIAALTAQNTKGVTAIHNVPADFVAAQIDAVFSDIRIDAVKIGMLANAEVIRTVAEGLRKWNARNIVIDPVMVTTSGDPLIADDAVETLKQELFPLATLVTPNLHEAARLSPIRSESGVAASRGEMRGQGKAILAQGARAVLVKGGHDFNGEHSATADDILVTAEGEEWFSADRIETENTHGTGCSLSSAIAANLARGMDLAEAVESAKEWLTAAIAASGQLDVGEGSGPVHHFHAMWPND
jgi:hydroxymethylpyrimidine/phosphomethylpyrimidine kinase